MATNLGTVMPIPKGEWVIGTTYKKLNIVSHKGSSYIAIQENAVEPSDDGINWMLVARGASIAQVGLPGVVMPDGDTIVIEENGTISTGVNVGVVNDIITERASDDIATKAEVQAVTDNLYKGNLLKNSNFKLNTNGLSEYAVANECVDGWRFWSGGSGVGNGRLIVDTENGAVIINNNDSALYSEIGQNFSPLKMGEKYTLSIEIDGVRNTYLLTGGNYINSGISLGNITMYYISYSDGSIEEIILRVLNKVASVKLREAKLELGTIATPYIEPDLEIEKVRCGVADYLPLTGGQISGTIRTRHIDGLYMPYPDDETLQELHLNYAYPKSRVYIYSGGTHGEALHRGNSKPVSISSTAPVDTEYLWIDTINMKTKIYKDGAWTIVT